MGMYDEVSLTCPHCGKTTTFQTKVGPCSLKHYSISELPPDMINKLNGRKEYCEKCDNPYYIGKRQQVIYQAVAVGEDS